MKLLQIVLFSSILIVTIAEAGEHGAKELEQENWTIYFGHNSAKLTEEAKKVLNSITQGAVVSIAGYASSSGTDRRNTDLSKERAIFTAIYLQNRGVTVSGVEGKSEYPGDYDLDKDRRAVIQLKKPGNINAKPLEIEHNMSIQVLPEITTRVPLSNRDINRITCPNGLPLKDAVYSTEKGISLKIEGSNAFVKYLIVKDAISGENKYRSDPTELYIVCGNNNRIFTLIGMPKDIPAQHIQLVSKEETIKKSLSLFEGMPFEKKVIMVIQKIYANNIPSAFTVKKIGKSFSVFKDIGITLNRIVVAEGEGMQVKEYILKLQESFKDKSVQLKEKDFLLPELTENPVAIALESQTLKKGRLTRLFILDRTGSRGNVNDF